MGKLPQSYPNEENSRKNTVCSTFSWTDLASDFPKLKSFVLSRFCEKKLARVRISVLEQNGKIARHADKPNKSDNLIPRKRFHFVLSSNEKCVIYSVKCDGMIENKTMKKGEIWQIHNVCPHWVENMGNCDRFHMIIDII